MEIEKGDVLYYGRTFSSSDTFEVLELTVRSVYEDYFVGVETRTKSCFLFTDKDIGKVIFTDRKECLDKVKAAEKQYKRTQN